MGLHPRSFPPRGSIRGRSHVVRLYGDPKNPHVGPIELSQRLHLPINRNVLSTSPDSGSSEFTAGDHFASLCTRRSELWNQLCIVFIFLIPPALTNRRITRSFLVGDAFLTQGPYQCLMFRDAHDILRLAYAPQLGDRLHISHTQLNVIGLGGNGQLLPLPSTSA